jgi:hypothetical protein
MAQAELTMLRASLLSPARWLGIIIPNVSLSIEVIFSTNIGVHPTLSSTRCPRQLCGASDISAFAVEDKQGQEAVIHGKD